MKMNEEELVPAEKVADDLGIKPSSLANWRAAGQGPAYVKVGRRIFYRPSDLDAWLKTCRVDPSAGAAR